MTALVTVIIPCRNAASWLAQAVESSLDQSWPAVEIIIVDNGSTDGSLAVARSYEGARLSVLECQRPGASAARNDGLAHANGDFIQFLDADDVLDRNKVALQMGRLATVPAGSIASGGWARFHGDLAEARFTPEPVWSDLAAEDFLISSWLGGGMMPDFAWLTPRAVIEAAGPWDESLSVGDDGEYFCRVALAASGILFCGEARGYYRSGAPDTLSRRRDRKALESAYRAIELSCEHLLARNHSSPARTACAALHQRFIYDVFPEVPDLVAQAEARVETLGGSDLQIEGGRGFQTIKRCLGWKAARRAQLQWHNLIARAS